MKKFYFIALALFSFGLQAQIINFPDANFKAKLVNSSTSNGTAADLESHSLKIDANSNGEIEVSEALNVGWLSLFEDEISDLTGIGYFMNLQKLMCPDNSLVTLDLTGLADLNHLDCSGNQLTGITLNGVTGLRFLTCSDNPITTLDFSQIPNLENLSAVNCQFAALNVSSLIHLVDLAVPNNVLTQLVLSPSIESLNCRINQLTALDISALSNLKTLIANTNNIAVWDFSNCPLLWATQIDGNNITELDLSNVPNLETLLVGNNQLTQLDLSNVPNLDWLDCSINQLTTLDLSNVTKLTKLTCGTNPYTSTILDVSHLEKLESLSCKSAGLMELYIKNGKAETLNFSGNPDLQYICADDSQIATVEAKITEYGYADCHVNSYCSFVPGGDFYTFQGNIKVDSNANGCTGTDFSAPNVKFSISNGTLTNTFITDDSGSFAMDLQAGNYTITPILENPAYLSVSPASVNVNFPVQPSPASQNFCIVPTPPHPDLEITLIPLQNARPGFPSVYKAVCRNAGNMIQSGTVTVTFDDIRTDLSSTAPTADAVAGNSITWNFTGLNPLESKDFSFILHVNSPSDTPPVNAGTVLAFTANAINPLAEETPENNIFNLNQTVVNSFDPNDKTCLEGNVISPESVGDYVHYVIRFENTGTFAAENVVVKDIIDTAKFDINTLIPLASSHSYTTRIEGNKVEFIFENINLPFDDANNDGYVAFKIKTRPTLVTGDTFSNSASIYFDYNFPIVTDPAVTAIQTLGNPDFEFSRYFTLYPNPAKDELNIATNAGIEMKSIAVYNILGQLVLAVPNAQGISVIDVSDLKSGNYFLKINSDKGTTNAKFVKN